MSGVGIRATEEIRRRVRAADYLCVVQLFLKDNYANGYYVRDTNLKVPFDWVRTNYDVINNNLKFASWPAVSILREVNPNIDIDKIEKTFGKTTA